MPRNRNRNRKRNLANDAERQFGLHGTTTAQAQDMFTNIAARLGFGTPNLGNGADYELVRLSYDYWKLITLFRNHWITRRIVEVPAQDMVKAWPKLTSDIEPKDITRIERAIRRTGTKNHILTGLTWGRLFGGGGGLIVIAGHENKLDEPLDLEDVGIGAYKGIIPFDRWAGISPNGEVCVDINRPLDFNKPEMYEVRTTGGDSFNVHSSRLLRFLGPSVPTPELEAQSYWGISVVEPIYEAITKLDNMSANILALTFRANILGMKMPDLAQLLSGVGASQQAAMRFEQRMSQLNHMLSNQSLVPLPADGGIEAASYTFGGLADVFQLFQLDLSGASQIPVSRLWGRTYNGLGQAGDADERIYEEKIATDQQAYLAPQLEKLFPVICMSELGEVPDDLDLNFPSVRVLDEKEKSELAKTVMDTVVVALNAGIMSQRTAAKEIKQSSDMTGIGTNLTDEDIAKLPDTPQAEGELGEGLFGEGGGLDPASSPAKVGKEENAQGKEDDDGDDDPDPAGPGTRGAEKEPEAAKPTAKATDALLRAFEGFAVERARIKDAAEWKEQDHPRAKNGQFGSGGGGGGASAMPKGMEHVTKGDHKTVASFAKALLAENKYSDADIAKAAQAAFGGKTSAASVAWYKAQAKKDTPEGKKAAAAKQAGIKANDAAIAKAKQSPMPAAQMDAALTKAEKAGYKTVYVSAKDASGKPVYVKLSDVPDGLDNTTSIGAALKKRGLTVSLVGKFDPKKPAPAQGYKDMALSESEANELKDAAYAKAKQEAEEAAAAKALAAQLNKPVTETTEELSESMQKAIKHYTNGSYGALNANLRKGQPLTAGQATLAADLDAAIKKAKLKEDTTLYRKMNHPQEFLGPNPKVGSVLIDNGFISTSKAKGVWSGSVHLTITCKKGAAALDVQSLSLHSGEKEVMLPRGSLFKVKGIKGLAVEVEYLG